MTQRTRVTLEMTPEGGFRTPRSVGLSWPLRIGMVAALVALAATAVTAAALLLWIASMLIPVALVAGGIAYVAFRLQAARARRPL